MEAKRVYLDDPSLRGVDIIIEQGYGTSMSAAIRIAVVQFAAAVTNRGPLVTPTTP